MEEASLPPVKKQRLQSFRFGSPSEASPSSSSGEVTGRTKATSKPKRFNTDKCTAWGTRVFRDWASERNARMPFEEQVPEDLLDRNFSTDEDVALLNHWFAKFVMEARSREGKPYPPNTIRGLLAAILRHMRSHDPDAPNFMSAKDPRFKDLQHVIETTIEDLNKQGVGTVVKRTPLLVSPEEEEKLWKECIFGVDTPLKLQRTVLFYVGKVLGIKGGCEHRALKPSQFFRYSSPDRYHVTMSAGGKVVAVNRNPGAGQRCPVFLLDQYLPRLPEAALDRDIFYVRPKADFTSRYWYDPTPLGREKLRTMVKDMCAEAGLSENVTVRKGKERASASSMEPLASVCPRQGSKSVPVVGARFPGITEPAALCASSSSNSGMVHVPRAISKAQQVVSRTSSFLPLVLPPLSQARDQQTSSVSTPTATADVAQVASQTSVGIGKHQAKSLPAHLQSSGIQMPQASVAKSVQIPATRVASQSQLAQSLQGSSRVLIQSRPLTPILPKHLSSRTQLSRYQIKPHYSSAELTGTQPSSNPVLQVGNTPRVCAVEMPSTRKQLAPDSRAQQTPISESIQTTTCTPVKAQVLDTFQTPIQLARVSDSSELPAVSIQPQTSANTLSPITPTQQASSAAQTEQSSDAPMQVSPVQTTQASKQVSAATQTSGLQASDDETLQTPGAAQISQASIAQIVQEAITQVLRSANIQVSQDPQSQAAHEPSPQLHQNQPQQQSTSQQLQQSSLQPQATSTQQQQQQQQQPQNPVAQVLQNSGGQPPQILLCPVIILKQ